MRRSVSQGGLVVIAKSQMATSQNRTFDRAGAWEGSIPLLPKLYF